MTKVGCRIYTNRHVKGWIAIKLLFIEITCYPLFIKYQSIPFPTILYPNSTRCWCVLCMWIRREWQYIMHVLKYNVSRCLSKCHELMISRKIETAKIMIYLLFILRTKKNINISDISHPPDPTRKGRLLDKRIWHELSRAHSTVQSIIYDIYVY